MTVAWARPARAEVILDRLDDGERARCAQLLRPSDRDRYASAHVLLRAELGRVLGADPSGFRFAATCRLCGGPHGRPRLLDQLGIEVSLSHAGERVAVAISTVGAVGVDVELDSACAFDGFADVALGPAERPAPPDAHERAVIWTRKEALLKSVGFGLAIAPDRVVVSAPAAAPRLVKWSAPDDPRPVHLVDVDIGPRHAASVAALCAQPPAVRLRPTRLD